jgi:hypothetical protein
VSTAAFFGYSINFEESKKLIRKKSKNPHNFIRLSRLSTRLSLGDTSPSKTQSESLNRRISKLGNRIIGNFTQKLFSNNNNNNNNNSKRDLEEHEENQSSHSGIRPASLGLSASTKYFLSPEESSSNETLTPLMRNPIKPTMSGSALNTLVDNLQHGAVSTSLIVNSTKNYVPQISQRSYSNRQEKLNDINNLLIKDSKMTFLFI